ncbi:MAG: hypothetical protein RR651_08610 [Lysinibacillus sp.]
MIRKTLILLCLVPILLISAKPINSTLISVFRVTDSPTVISKGHYGTSLVVEISYSNDELLDWLTNVKEPYPLLLLDANWIERSPEHIRIIQERKLPTGLLGTDNEEEPDLALVKKEIHVYKKYFQTSPLWFSTMNHQYSEELQQSLFKQQINLINPSIIWSTSKKSIPTLQKGDLLFIPAHNQNSISFSQLNKLLKANTFISIEENIFGYTIKSKKFP